jgi:hypothetical protein
LVPAKVRDIYRWAKYRASKKGLAFDIEVEDIVVPFFCPIMGLELKFNKGFALFNSPTLDRIDNSKGYIKGNIQVISQLANLMKSNANVAELLVFSEWIQKTYGKV